MTESERAHGESEKAILHSKLTRLAAQLDVPKEHVRFATYDIYSGIQFVAVERWESLVDDTWQQLNAMELPEWLDE